MPPASDTRCPAPRGQKGFSLLEAIVALVILAGTCMALFAWINTSLTQLRRAELYSEAAPVIASATQYLKTVDLDQRPSGTFSSGSISVDWEASPLEHDVTRSAAYGNSNFLLSLYNVNLAVRSTTGKLPAFHTRIVKYRLKPGLPDLQNGI